MFIPTGLEIYGTVLPFVIILVLGGVVFCAVAYFTRGERYDRWLAPVVSAMLTMMFTFMIFGINHSASLANQKQDYLENAGYLIVEHEDGIYQLIGPDGERQVAQFQYVQDGQYRVVIR
jgi:hypothetical protein